jgi:hypothetical protein
MGRHDLKEERAYRGDFRGTTFVAAPLFDFDPIGNTPAMEGDRRHVFAAYPEAKPSS